MKKNEHQISLYLQPPYRERAADLIALLEKRGVKLVDQKGNSSISALVKYLIDEELKRQR